MLLAVACGGSPATRPERVVVAEPSEATVPVESSSAIEEETIAVSAEDPNRLEVDGHQVRITQGGDVEVDGTAHDPAALSEGFVDTPWSVAEAMARDLDGDGHRELAITLARDFEESGIEGSTDIESSEWAIVVVDFDRNTVEAAMLTREFVMRGESSTEGDSASADDVECEPMEPAGAARLEWRCTRCAIEEWHGRATLGTAECRVESSEARTIRVGGQLPHIRIGEAEPGLGDCICEARRQLVY